MKDVKLNVISLQYRSNLEKKKFFTYFVFSIINPSS